MSGARKGAGPAAQLGPSSGGFVSLTEALSWIAFRTLLGEPGLKAHVENDVASSDHLERAVGQFVTVASSGIVRVRGRYVAHFRDEVALADTDDIPANRLKDFCQFDLDVGGLRRCPPGGDAILWRGSPSRFEREFASYAQMEADAPGVKPGGLAEGYREVEVWRDDLMQAFPISLSQAAPPHAEIVAWCRTTFAAGVTNMNDAWATFHQIAKFRGLL